MHPESSYHSGGVEIYGPILLLGKLRLQVLWLGPQMVGGKI